MAEEYGFTIEKTWKEAYGHSAKINSPNKDGYPHAYVKDPELGLVQITSESGDPSKGVDIHVFNKVKSPYNRKSTVWKDGSFKGAWERVKKAAEALRVEGKFEKVDSKSEYGTLHHPK